MCFLQSRGFAKYKLAKTSNVSTSETQTGFKTHLKMRDNFNPLKHLFFMYLLQVRVRGIGRAFKVF